MPHEPWSDSASCGCSRPAQSLVGHNCQAVIDSNAMIVMHITGNNGTNSQHQQTPHTTIFNQSSQKSVCLKYLASCSYYSKTRTCRSTADIFCLLLTAGLLRAKKEKQKCIKVVFYFGKLNDLDPRSLSQSQLKFATQNRSRSTAVSKVLGLLGTFTTWRACLVQPSLLV